MQDMPTGQYTRRLEEDGFKKRWSGKMAIEWLEWQAYSRGISTTTRVQQHGEKNWYSSSPR